MQKRIYLLFLIIITSVLFLANKVFADTTTDSVIEIMRKFGLENIQVKDNSDSSKKYLISYENRTFLHEINLLGSLLSSLKGQIAEDSNLVFLPKSRGKVISKISLNFQDYLDFIAGKIDEAKFAEKIEITLNPNSYLETEVINPLFLHSDIVLAPSYILDHTTGPTLFLSPYSNTYFDHGFSFSSRFRVPVYNIENGFDISKNFNLYPPGFISSYVDYSTPILDLPLFTTLRSGFIYNNSAYKAVLLDNLQYLIWGGIGRLNLFTGVNYNLKFGYPDFSITPSVQYYPGIWDLLFEAGGGKFFNNYGGWGRVTRQFNNVDLGFSIFRFMDPNNKGWGLNFEFNLAIGPEHGIDASLFRFTYPINFSGYLYSGNSYDFSLLGYSNDEFIKRLYPEYIKTHLYYWKRSEGEVRQ